MTEKLIHSLPPTTALPPFVTFDDCKKGETAAKTGCTPASGEGSKKPTDAEIDEFEKDLDRRKEEMDKGGSGEGPSAEDKKKEEDWRWRERALDIGTRGDTRRVAEAAGMTSPIGDANVSKKDKETLRVLMDHFDANWDKWKNQKGESFSPDEFKDWFSAQVPGLKDAIEKGSEAPAAEETASPPSALPYDDSKVDEDAFTELELFLENDGDIYQQKIQPMIKNVQRKMKSGKYDHSLAPKLWNYAVEEAAKKYTKEMGSPGQKPADLGFTKDTRRKLANAMADDYRDSIEAGDYD